MVINAKEARERVLENKMSKEELEREVIYYLVKIDKSIRIAIQQRKLFASYFFHTPNEELINTAIQRLEDKGYEVNRDKYNTNLIKINW